MGLSRRDRVEREVDLVLACEGALFALPLALGLAVALLTQLLLLILGGLLASLGEFLAYLLRDLFLGANIVIAIRAPGIHLAPRLLKAVDLADVIPEADALVLSADPLAPHGLELAITRLLIHNPAANHALTPNARVPAAAVLVGGASLVLHFLLHGALPVVLLKVVLGHAPLTLALLAEGGDGAHLDALLLIRNLVAKAVGVSADAAA